MAGVRLFGVGQVESYQDGLERIFAFLAEFPRAARLRNEVEPAARVYPYKSHLIVYDVVDDGILIIRIRHGREDWQNDI